MQKGASYMSGKRFAYQYSGYGEEQGVPPWLRHRGRNAHFSGLHHRHGPFSYPQDRWGESWTPTWLQEESRRPHFFGMHRGRGPSGPGGPFGFRGEGGRFFGRGDMKFALLELIQERPMHGYEMMKALEEKTGGFYTPSPGSIYPTLQMLEDRGLVSVQEVEGKKVYSITDAGRALLAEQQRDEGDFGGPPWKHWHGRAGHRAAPEMQALRSEAGELVRLFAIAGRISLQDPERLARLRAIIEHTRKDLTDMIYGAGTLSGGQVTQPGQASSTAT